MNVFLLIFDRGERRLVELDEYPASARRDAEEARFQAELAALKSGRDVEIVTLEAGSLDELRRTHGSYFLDKLPLAG